MDINTNSHRMSTLLVLYEMQTKFLLSALDGISDTDAHERLNTKANHIAWLTGSLVQQRFELAGILGKPKIQNAHELFKDNQGLKDGITYPSLKKFKKAWEAISPDLKDSLAIATDDQLTAPFEMPGHSMPLFDFITFLIYREANCIGQIALWRRLLGYDPMKYY